METPARGYMNGQLCDIRATQKQLSLSRSTVYQLLSEGAFESVKIGQRRLVVRSSLDAYVAALPRAA